MTRKHRSFHRLIWPILAVTVGLGLAFSLSLRAPPEPATQERRT